MEEQMRQWVLMNPIDNVATALAKLRCGTEIHDATNQFHVQLRQDIPFGHKFAVRPIDVGDFVYKYGQVIGAATQRIQAGEHVHVQNVESRRGRGDLKQEGTS